MVDLTILSDALREFYAKGDEDKYLQTHSGSILRATVPEKYRLSAEIANWLEQLPSWDLEPTTIQESYHLLTSVADRDIIMINGIVLNPNYLRNCLCNQCSRIITDQIHHCLTCHIDLCKECFAAAPCREHKLIPPIPVDMCVPPLCTECQNSSIPYYRDHTGAYHCYACAKENETELTPEFIVDYCCYGSILDWMPIARSSESSLLYVNTNPHSPYYNSVSCSYRYGDSEAIDLVATTFPEFLEIFRQAEEHRHDFVRFIRYDQHLPDYLRLFTEI